MNDPVRQIGAGKLAIVSESRTAQGQIVAVKQYDRQLLSAFKHERLFAAAAHWQTLSHPRLVRYLNVDPAQNRILMECMASSAAIRLCEGAVDPRSVLQTLRDILEGLAYLHGQGLLHLNLKPANVLYGLDGRARLSDGLLASVLAPGTLPPPTDQKYLTPEHTSDSWGAMSPSTDLYAAGFLALEMLGGRRFGRAFEGIGDESEGNDLAWFQWHASPAVAPAATIFCASCPAELANVIGRLVSKSPRDRFGSAREALEQLPLEMAPPVRPADRPAAPAPATPREAYAEHVLKRPKTGVVLHVASGAWAGKMVGTNDTDWTIGFEPDALLQFSREEYPGCQTSLRVQLGRDGWCAERIGGGLAFVNQQVLEGRHALRSGDILRLSPRGPDVQFTMQSGGATIAELAARYLAERPPAAPASVHSKAPGVAPRRPAVAAGPSAPPAAVPPAGARAAGALPAAAPAARGPAPAPTPSTLPSPVATVPVSAVPVSAAPRAAAPAAARAPAPAPSKPAFTPAAPAAPRRPNSAPVLTPVDAPESGAPRAASAPPAKGALVKTETPRFSWLAPATWSKDQKNLVIGVVGGLFVLILVILFPTGQPTAPPPGETPPASSPPASQGTTPAENVPPPSSSTNEATGVPARDQASN